MLGAMFVITGLLLTVGSVGGAEFGKMNWMAAAIGVAIMAVGAVMTRQEAGSED